MIACILTGIGENRTYVELKFEEIKAYFSDIPYSENRTYVELKCVVLASALAMRAL